MNIPGLTADQTSDACHVLALLYSLALAVHSVVFKVVPNSDDIALVGVLFAGGITNSRLNGTPGQ